MGRGNQKRELTQGEACAVLGYAACRAEIEGNEAVAFDAIWRFTPVASRGEMLNDAFGTYDAMDTSTYEFGNSLRVGLREEEVGFPRAEPRGKWVSGHLQVVINRIGGIPLDQTEKLRLERSQKEARDTDIARSIGVKAGPMEGG